MNTQPHIQAPTHHQLVRAATRRRRSWVVQLLRALVDTVRRPPNFADMSFSNLALSRSDMHVDLKYGRD